MKGPSGSRRFANGRSKRRTHSLVFSLGPANPQNTQILRCALDDNIASFVILSSAKDLYTL